MAEVIKTVLTADSSELATEFAKASAIAQKYAAEREAQGNRALATACAEVDALRMEAGGHGAASAALREKMHLIEQARRLSTQAGISEENATRILARQLDLKKQMVTAAAAVAVAEQRAGRIAAPGRNGIALPEMALTAANLQAMEKAQARAGEVQRKMGQFGKNAGTGKAMGLLAVSAAVEDAQYGFNGVINNIPQAVMAFGNFTPAAMRLAAGFSMVAVAGYAAYKMGYALGADKSVLAWAEAQTAAVNAAKESLERYQEATRNRRQGEAIAIRINQERERENWIIERGLKLDGDRVQATEKQRAAIERKRAAEDSILSAAKQSGVIPGDSITSASRHLEDARTVEDVAAAQKRLTELGKEWERIWGEVPRLAGQYAEKSRADAQELEKASDSLDMLKSKQSELNVLLDKKDAYGPGDLARFQKDLENIKRQIDERENLIANKKAERELQDSLAKQANTEARASMERLRKQQEMERDRLDQLNAAARLQKQLRMIEDAKASKATSDWKAEFAIQQALAANDVERARMLERHRDIEAEKRRIMAEQQGISEAMAGKQAASMVDTRADASAAAAKKTAAEELAVLRARAVGENNRAGQLRAAANLENQILQIMKDQNLTREQAAKQTRELQELQRNKARGDIIGEMKALRMEASGDKKGADRLREEMRIREESVALAERLSITESQAQSLLREKSRIEKEIADRQKNGGQDSEHSRVRARGQIYTKTTNETRLTRDNMGEGFTGLRNFELHRRGSERTNRPATPSDDAAKNLLKSVNIQEEMLKIWQKLNVI